MKVKNTWNKGVPMSQEHKRKLSEIKLKNPVRYWLGKKRPPLSEETRMKISLAHIGKKYPFKNKKSRGGKEERFCKVCSKSFMEFKSNRHNHCSPECRLISKRLRRGDKNPAWKGGITPENSKIRHSLEYNLWRKAVFERDHHTCQECEKVGGILNAHHIKPFAFFPELRTAIDNGTTLCKECHKTKTYGNRIRGKPVLSLIQNVELKQLSEPLPKT